MGATRRVGGFFARRGGADGRPPDDVVTGKLEGALINWGLYKDGVRDQRVNSYTDALAKARRGQGFVWIGLFQPTDHQLATSA